MLNLEQTAKLNYFSFFTVKRCLYTSRASVVLLVDFNLYDETSGNPEDSILKLTFSSREKFNQESKLSKLSSNNHPLFPEFYYSTFDASLGANYLFMQNCQKSSLRNTKTSNADQYPSSRMNRPQMAYTLKSLAKAVKILHSQNVSHRDLKLENIFITFENYLKIGDFGSAKLGSDDCETLIFSDCYSSPQICMESNQRDTKKDDVWAMGVCFLMLCLGKREFLNREEFSSRLLQVVEDLAVDHEIKRMILKCLENDENLRAGSDEIYKLCKEYCERVFREVQKSHSERRFFEMIAFKFETMPNLYSNLNSLKKIQGNKEKCKICGKAETKYIKYRKFHRVHIGCLESLLIKYSTAPTCLICNLNPEEQTAEKSLDDLKVNILSYKNCQKPKTTLESYSKVSDLGKCRHFVNALTKNYKSSFLHCTEADLKFCTLCPVSEIHYHCAGYRKHLDYYQKKALLKMTFDKKVYLLKYSLVYWQIRLPGNRFRSQQVMKKYESNEDNFSMLHIHEFCSLFNKNFVALDFWYIKNCKNKKKSVRIRAYYEYFCDGTLMEEWIYRKNNRLVFDNSEIQLLEVFISQVVDFMHRHFIYHSYINPKYIYITKSETGKIVQFKLAGLEHAKLFTEFNEEEEIKDLLACQECINFIKELNS